eukprot:3913493-Rhodomonas_salina.1
MPVPDIAYEDETIRLCQYRTSRRLIGHATCFLQGERVGRQADATLVPDIAYRMRRTIAGTLTRPSRRGKSS